MSRDKQKTEIPAEKLELYDRLIRERPLIERKGAGLPYTSVNGHMFSFLSASGTLALRLPAENREAFLAQHGTTLFVAHGATLKEYVEVPEALFANTVELLPYLDKSYEYALGLKPKQQRKAGGKAKKRTRK
jgi:TfoX/Sxy family transcriptional regulator of competence genes